MHLGISENELIAYDSPTYANEIKKLEIKQITTVATPAKWMITKQLQEIDVTNGEENQVVALAFPEEERSIWLTKLYTIVEAVAYQDLRLAKNQVAAELAAQRLFELENLDEDKVTEVCKKCLDSLFCQEDQSWPAQLCSELARRAADSVDARHIIVRALSGRVSWALIAQRLEDATRALIHHVETVTKIDQLLAVSLCDLITTLATRPSGSMYLDSRLAVLTQLKAAGIHRLLDDLRGVAEALELKALDDASLPSTSSMDSTTSVQRQQSRRQSLTKRLFGKRRTDSFQSGLETQESSKSLTIATDTAAAIKAVFDEYEERVLDDEARAAARIKKAKNDLDAAPPFPRDALETLVSALHRDLLFNIVAGRDDATSFRLLQGQDASFFTSLRNDPLMNKQQNLRHHKPRRLLTRQLSTSAAAVASSSSPELPLKQEEDYTGSTKDQAPGNESDGTDKIKNVNQPATVTEQEEDPRAALNAMILKSKKPADDPRAALNAMILNKKAPPSDAPTTIKQDEETSAPPKKDPYKVFKMRLLSCRDDDDRAGLAAAMVKDGLDPAKIGLSAMTATAQTSATSRPEPAQLGVEPKIMLKGFHWDKLEDKAAYQATWWAKNQSTIEREAVVQALPLIENIFPAPSVNAPTIARKQSKGDETQAPPPSVFDSDRLQAAAFALRSLRARGYSVDDPTGVVLQILDLDSFDDDDEDELDKKLEELKMLEQAVLPTKAEDDSAEFAKLQSAASRPMQDEAKFAFQARKAVPDSDIRAEIHLVRAYATLNARIDEATERLERKDTATEAVHSSDELRFVLRLALYTGNVLNHSAPGRQAAGVKVSGLATLASTKATNPNGNLTTALDLIASIARDVDAEQARNLKPLLYDPLDAIKNDEPIDDVLTSLQSDMNLAQKRTKYKDLAQRLKTGIDQLKSLKIEVDRRTRDVLVSFGEKASTRDPRPFFAALLDFINSFDAVILRLDQQEAEKALEKRQNAARKRRLLRKATSKTDSDPYDAPDTKHLSLLAVANAVKNHSLFGSANRSTYRPGLSITSFYDDEPPPED
uniref:FH2 domain-containing protein n=1 Tax=Aureoumbra lagunensis TaxID=44058 RepID=A0A7S3K1W6_9STRA